MNFDSSPSRSLVTEQMSAPVVPPTSDTSTSSARHKLISEWKPINKNTLLGAFTVTLPSGMVIQGCMVHRTDGREWVALPGAAQIDRDGTLKRGSDGKVEYKTLVRFVSKVIYERFQTPILEELRRLGHI